MAAAPKPTFAGNIVAVSHVEVAAKGYLSICTVVRAVPADAALKA